MTLGALIVTAALVLPQAATAQSGWGGRWIWVAAARPNQWVAFRTQLVLDAAPAQALARIAADSKYWLYVNGELVVFEGGLKRGPAPQASYYDEVDLAPYLQPGQNTIAVLVWYFGKSGFSHSDSGRGGLLFDAHTVVGGERRPLVSNAAWRAAEHPGYGDDPGTAPNDRLPESHVFYDARRAAVFEGWLDPAFDASAWPAAVEQAIAGAAPWGSLARRPVPLFRFGALRSYERTHTAASGATTVYTAELPSNLQVTPFLEVEAPEGAVIRMQTDHYDDGGAPNLRATYITREGAQEFEALGWMSGTAVVYHIPPGVRVVGLRYRESGYATAFVGSFASDQPFFDALWLRARRSVYVNMRDTFMDCPTRERAQWWGDVVSASRAGFYAFDQQGALLTRKAIRELIGWQRSDGVLYAPIPGTWRDELPSQSLAAVWSLWGYYLHSGDAETLRAAYPHIKAYLLLWQMGDDGLVVHRAGGWDWFDWGEHIDEPVLENAWYSLALDTALRMARLAGEADDLPVWQARQAGIARAYNAAFWDQARGAYRSPGHLGETDDRANALAVVAGLADASFYPAIRTVLREQFHASPYMEFYVLEALYLMRAPDDAERRMRLRYEALLRAPGYTLPEFWSPDAGGTDNHAWNSGPLLVLSAYAAGVRPLEPGYASFLVQPQPGGFGRLRATVPTPGGDAVVGVERVSPAQLRLSVVVPQGAAALVAVPRAGGAPTTIRANGTTIYSADQAADGVGGLRLVRRDAEYVYWQAPEGGWVFESIAHPPGSTRYLPAVGR